MTQKKGKKIVKLSDLLKEAQAIKDEYGDLEIHLVITTPSGDGASMTISWGELHGLEVEERKILNLFSEITN